MALIPKQIGWSEQSNLLYEVLRELDKLIKVTSSKIPTTTSTTTPAP